MSVIEIQLSHKLIVLCDILVDTIDKCGLSKEDGGKEFTEKLIDARTIAEIVVRDGFSCEELTRSNYLQDLSIKIDELIDNKYKELTT